ncbi:MAG: hypothetical protein V3V95_09150, partial [Thermodesulfobacteriota bacterium]
TLTGAGKAAARYPFKLFMKEKESKRTHTAFTPTRAHFFLAAFIIAALTFVIYLPSLGNDFVLWEDNLMVYDNPNIRSLDLAFIKWAFTAIVIASWYPLTHISFALDYAVWGLNPWGFHLTNTILHSLNTLLVFFLISGLVKAGSTDADSDNPGIKLRALFAGGVAALFFGLHPLRVESVAWVVERKDLLYAFFYLLSIVTYLRYATSDSGRSRFYIISILLFAMSLASKSMAVTLPAILLILDYYPLRRFRIKDGGLWRAKKVLAEKIPFFALTIIISIVTVWTHQKAGGLILHKTYPLATRVIMTVHSYIFYLYKMLLPLKLAPIYPAPANENIASFEYIGALALFILISAFCVISFKKSPLFSAAWLYFLVILSPTVGISQAGWYFAADRYTYLSSLGPMIVAVLGISLLFEKASKRGIKALIVTFVLIISVIYASLSVGQMAIWKDTITLWSYEIALYPDRSLTAHNNRAIAYYGEGRYAEAIEDLIRTIKIEPRLIDTYYNIARIYATTGEDEKAITAYKIAARMGDKESQKYLKGQNIGWD